MALHFHLGWTLNAYGQGSGTRLGVVDDELGLSTYRISAETFFWGSRYGPVNCELSDECPTSCASLQSGSVHRDQTRVSSLSWFPDPNLERTSWNVRAIEFDINGMETVLPGDEPDGVFIWRTNRRTRHNFYVLDAEA